MELRLLLKNRSSCILQTAGSRSSVTPTLARTRLPSSTGHVAVSELSPGSGGRPGWKATHSAWRRWWHLLKSGSATRSTSTLAHSYPPLSSHGSAMVELGRRLLLTTPKQIILGKEMVKILNLGRKLIKSGEKPGSLYQLVSLSFLEWFELKAMPCQNAITERAFHLSRMLW